ncbi:type II secretion system F family protein [Massilia litorea]|jgi:type II secretory pathway component PulF|uniref:Type II secretion system F family protein n=1 Tax=Massilia litorea TaxID=2769491 RepID=A0A7L9U8M5_9BURK|nr:type II secretion system F family protein [Massilia litorea]QOL50779.1 type II secretion system F family protein [Massilia litorea]
MALEWDDLPAPVTATELAGPAAAKAAARKPAWTFTQERIGSADRMLFTERLALLLETGVPLHDALGALRDQTVKPRLKAIIGEVADAIVGGQRFSEALNKHPDLFPPTYINLIGASEEGGFLAEVLEQLVDMDEKQERLRSTIVSALSYPGFLIVFSILVVVFILVAVFPKFSVMFTAIYDELPLTTKIFIAASNALTRHGTVFGIGALVLVGGLLVASRRPDVHEWLDRMKLRVPFVKDIFIKIYLTRLMRVMGISLERGVTILATLGACRNVIPNAEFQRFIGDLEVQVTEGRGIAAGFRDSSLIPVSVKQMIDTGEQTGSLGRVMGRVADFYERDLTRQLNALAKMAEPVMLLVMGVLVGTIVTSIILPIFKMSRAVH